MGANRAADYQVRNPDLKRLVAEKILHNDPHKTAILARLRTGWRIQANFLFRSARY